MERSISRHQSLQCTSRDGGGGRNEGFLVGSVGDAAMPPKNIGESDGDEFNSTGEGDRSGG